MSGFPRIVLIALAIAFVWVAALAIEAGVACTRGERAVLAAQGIIGLAACATEGGMQSVRQFRLPGIG